MKGQTTGISEVLMTAQRYIDSLPAGDGQWLAEQRRAAVERLFDLGLPHARQEAWRYTDVQRLLDQGFVTADQAGEIPEAEIQRRFLPQPVAARLVFAGLALTFATAAIPIRLDGEWITIAWALEGALLIWAGFRSGVVALRVGGLVLFLAVIGLLLAQAGESARPFLNERFASFVAAVGAFAACAR